jgi:hypothetical protein
MSLPKTLEQEFWREVRQLEEETRRPYITSVERRGRQQGRQEGEAILILRLLNRRLGQVSAITDSLNWLVSYFILHLAQNLPVDRVVERKFETGQMLTVKQHLLLHNH